MECVEARTPEVSGLRTLQPRSAKKRRAPNSRFTRRGLNSPLEDEALLPAKRSRGKGYSFNALSLPASITERVPLNQCFLSLPHPCRSPVFISSTPVRSRCNRTPDNLTTPPPSVGLGGNGGKIFSFQEGVDALCLPDLKINFLSSNVSSEDLASNSVVEDRITPRSSFLPQFPKECILSSSQCSDIVPSDCGSPGSESVNVSLKSSDFCQVDSLRLSIPERDLMVSSTPSPRSPVSLNSVATPKKGFSTPRLTSEFRVSNSTSQTPHAPRRVKLYGQMMCRVIRSRDLKELNRLLEDGVDPNVEIPFEVNAEPVLPLIVCCSLGNVAFVRCLLEKGAVANSVTSSMQTGLHVLSSLSAYKDSCALTSVSEVQPSVASDVWLSLYSFLDQECSSLEIEPVCDPGLDAEVPLIPSLNSFDLSAVSVPEDDLIETASILIEWGVDVQAKDSAGCTAVHLARSSGLLKLEAFLKSHLESTASRCRGNVEVPQFPSEIGVCEHVVGTKRGNHASRDSRSSPKKKRGFVKREASILSE